MNIRKIIQEDAARRRNLRTMNLNNSSGVTRRKTFRVTFEDAVGMNTKLLEADKFSDAILSIEAKGFTVLDARDITAEMQQR